MPPEIIIPSIPKSETYTLRMLVKSRDSKSLRVKSVESSEEFIKARFQKNESGSYFIDYTINRVLDVEGKTFVVTIILENNDGQIELKCPIIFEQ